METKGFIPGNKTTGQSSTGRARRGWITNKQPEFISQAPLGQCSGQAGSVVCPPGWVTLAWPWTVVSVFSSEQWGHSPISRDKQGGLCTNSVVSRIQ